MYSRIPVDWTEVIFMVVIAAGFLVFVATRKCGKIEDEE